MTLYIFKKKCFCYKTQGMLSIQITLKLKKLEITVKNYCKLLKLL